jgi:hypothetical protein
MKIFIAKLAAFWYVCRNQLSPFFPDQLNEVAMRLVSAATLVLFLSLLTFSQATAPPDVVKPKVTAILSTQDRQAALEKFDKLKATVAALENVVLAPEKEDLEAAAKENVEAFRILPREIYDNSFSSIRGGGAYYSFYFRIPDWGYGTDIGLEQNLLSTGFNEFGLLADLGEISLGNVSTESKSVLALMNYQKANGGIAERDYQKIRQDGLKLENTTFVTRLTPIVGHVYILRSSRNDYYDVLVAFKIFRKDSDGSLIILWKTLQQFDTPRRNTAAAVLSDLEIQNKSKQWLHDNRFRDVTFTVENGVATLRGTVDKSVLAYAIQLASEGGASKVINLLGVR